MTVSANNSGDSCNFHTNSLSVKPRRSAAEFRMREQSDPSSKKLMIFPATVGMVCIDKRTGAFGSICSDEVNPVLRC